MANVPWYKITVLRKNPIHRVDQPCDQIDENAQLPLLTAPPMIKTISPKTAGGIK
jgi:hypothetical protein